MMSFLYAAIGFGPRELAYMMKKDREEKEARKSGYDYHLYPQVMYPVVSPQYVAPESLDHLLQDSYHGMDTSDVKPSDLLHEHA